jgi:hypothetical protein
MVEWVKVCELDMKERIGREFYLNIWICILENSTNDNL